VAPSDASNPSGPPPHLGTPGPRLSDWFEAPTWTAWEAAATKVLKGRPLEGLDLHLPHGVVVPPASPPDAPVPDPGPMDASPWVRVGSDRVGVGWDVRARLDRGDATQVATDARVALSLGARSLQLVVGDGAADVGPDHLPGLLQGVDPGAVPVDLDVGDVGPWVPALVAWVGEAGDRATGALAMDPLPVRRGAF